MLTSKQFDDWIAALRSKHYIQGRKALRNNHDGYCCLGVLAKTLGAKWTFYKDEQCYLAELEGYPDSNLAYLPREIIALPEQIILGELNDIEQLNFEQIADYLEQNRDTYVNE